MVVAGQIVVGGVDVRLVATGLADTTFQVVGDNGLGDTAVKGKRADMGADPVLKALAGGGLDIGITACTQYGDKDLSVADCAGCRIDDINGLAGIVNEQLFSCPMFMAHGNIQAGGSVTVTVAEPAVLIAVRVLLLVLLPEQVESDTLA